MGVLQKPRNARPSSPRGGYMPWCGRRFGKKEEDCGACLGGCTGHSGRVSPLRPRTNWRPVIQSEPWFMATDERFVLRQAEPKGQRTVYRRSEPHTDDEKSRDEQSRKRDDRFGWKVR